METRDMPTPLTPMSTTDDVVSRLWLYREGLRPAERKVAETILADLDFGMRASIADLAQRAGVSEPTVTRFCRALGCAGLKDFKLRLAQSLAVGVPYLHRSAQPEDDTGVLIDKVFDGVANALEIARRSLDPASMKAAILALSAARRVDFFGVGAGSGIVAQDAQMRFFRLDMAANAFSDGHLQLMSAAILEPGDAAVGISHTGRSREIIESLTVARSHGATTIAITAAGTPLAGACDIPILVHVPEDTDFYAPSVSRLAHLTIIDTLAVGVALRRGPKVLENLRRVKAALAGQRMRGPALPI